MTTPIVTLPQDFVEHVTKNPSQYDSTCRALAAEVLERRAEVERLKWLEAHHDGHHEYDVAMQAKLHKAKGSAARLMKERDEARELAMHIVACEADGSSCDTFHTFQRWEAEAKEKTRPREPGPAAEMAGLHTENAALRTFLREACSIALGLFDKCKCGKLAAWACWDAAGDCVYRCDEHRIFNGGMLGDSQPVALKSRTTIEQIRSWLDVATAEVSQAVARDAARCVSQIAAKATLPTDGKRLRDEAKALRAAIKLLRAASRKHR